MGANVFTFIGVAAVAYLLVFPFTEWLEGKKTRKTREERKQARNVLAVDMLIVTALAIILWKVV